MTSSWESNFSSLFSTNMIEAKFIHFPIHPPGNDSIFVSNKAHRSDFVRLQILKEFGGIYLDTDVFVISNRLHSLREHSFVMGFDNIVFPAKDNIPHKLNNGVIVSAVNASFLKIWTNSYNTFDTSLWDMHSSVIPYALALEYPDLIQIEMQRISPFSFGFSTAKAAIALTCGILDIKNSTIWSPRFDKVKQAYTFEDTTPDAYIYKSLTSKLLFHLTMSQVR